MEIWAYPLTHNYIRSVLIGQVQVFSHGRILMEWKSGRSKGNYVVTWIFIMRKAYNKLNLIVFKSLLIFIYFFYSFSKTWMDTECLFQLKMLFPLCFG